jgi:hypothetical protein
MQFTKNLSKTPQNPTNYFFTIFEAMDKGLKNILTISGAYLAIRLYKLYQLGESVIYKPVGVEFVRGATLNDFVVRVKMELLNPTNTILPMKGIDGSIAVENSVIGSFSSAPFTIKAGINYFFLDFKVDPKTTGATLVRMIAQNKKPVFDITLNKKLYLFSMTEKFTINPNMTGMSDQVFVK